MLSDYKENICIDVNNIIGELDLAFVGYKFIKKINFVDSVNDGEWDMGVSKTMGTKFFLMAFVLFLGFYFANQHKGEDKYLFEGFNPLFDILETVVLIY